MDNREKTTREILDHVRVLRLPKSGIEYVERALEAPSRLTAQTRHVSVATRFASAKMGQVIQAESRTCELPFLHAQELDDDVLACLDQPPPLYVESVDRRGRRHRTRKTPDYLVIRRDGAYLFECKTSSALSELAGSQPTNWVFDKGNFRYLPMEAPAAALGIAFRVHNAATIGPVQAANLRMLVTAKRANIAPLPERLRNRALRVLTSQNALTLSDLATELKIDSVTPIIASVLRGELKFLMRWQLLSMPESTTIYPTASLCDQAERTLAAAASADCLRPENFDAPLALSSKAFARVSLALARIRRIRTGELLPTRSDYRHLAALKRADAAGDIPLLALAPAFNRRGRRSYLPDAAEEIIAKEIREHYARPERWSISSIHISIGETLESLDLSPVAYETVRQRVRSFSRTKLAREREGYRAENAAMPPFAIDESVIRAGYAWECAHVDATIVDEKVWLQFGLSNFFERPTIYLLVDESTSKILAYWVCFGDAGDQATACLFRDCIRRYGMLPCSIMHDRGAEYFSIYAETFTAAVGVDLIRRPSAAPRFGSYVEAAFNRSNHLLVHRMAGNTQNDKLGRSSTADKRSSAHVRNDLLVFLQTAEDGLMGHMEDRPVNDNVVSPGEKFEASQRLFAGMARSVSITPEMLAHTAIPSKHKEPYRIDYTHGINFKHRRYVGPGIKDPALHGKKAHIRWEPYNPCIIYAEVKGRWERLTCRGYQELENAGYRHRMVEFYMRFDTAKASRLAKRSADYQMAQRFRDQLTKSMPPLSVDLPEDVTPNDALFSQARSLQLDLPGRDEGAV